MLHKNQVVDAKQILDHAWDSNADFFPDTLKYHIHAIKKKLTEAGGSENLIKMCAALAIWWWMNDV